MNRDPDIKTLGQDPPPPARWRFTRLALGFIIAFCLILGLVTILEFQKSPYFTAPIIDEEGYISWARSIVAGDLMGKEVFYQDPLYPYLLALVFKVFGENLFLVRLLQAFIGAAAVGLVFLTARKLLSDRAALLAAAIMALGHSLYFFELQILKATLVIFLAALAGWIGVMATERPKAWPRWFGLGAVLGLLALLRGNVLASLPVIILWAMLLAGKDRIMARAGRAVPLFAGVVLVLAPVTIRNYMVSGELVISTSQGGPNFYIGNNEKADGTYTGFNFVFPNPRFEGRDFKRAAEDRTGKTMTGAQVSRFWFEQGLDWIKGHPGDAARLWLGKARLMIHQFEIPDNQSFYVTRQYFAPALWVPFLGMGLLWGPALLGAWVLCRRDPRAWFPALWAITYSLSIIPFYIMDRYRVAVTPALCLFAAAFIAWAREKWSRAQYLPLGSALVLAAGSLWLGLHPIPQSLKPYPMIYYNLGRAYMQRGEPEHALPWLDMALDLGPENPDFREAWTAAVSHLEGPRGVSLLMAEKDRGTNGPADLMVIGQRLEELGDRGKALQVYKLAAMRSEDFFPAQERLFIIFAADPDLRDPEKALSRLQKVVSLWPDYKNRPPIMEAAKALKDYLILSGDTATAERLRKEIMR